MQGIAACSVNERLKGESCKSSWTNTRLRFQCSSAAPEHGIAVPNHSTWDSLHCWSCASPEQAARSGLTDDVR